MLCLLLLSIFIIALVILLAIGAMLSVNTYAGGIYKKDSSKPWAVIRPGQRTAYYANEEDARRDAADNLVYGGRGEIQFAGGVRPGLPLKNAGE